MDDVAQPLIKLLLVVRSLADGTDAVTDAVEEVGAFLGVAHDLRGEVLARADAGAGHVVVVAGLNPVFERRALGRLRVERADFPIVAAAEAARGSIQRELDTPLFAVDTVKLEKWVAEKLK